MPNPTAPYLRGRRTADWVLEVPRTSAAQKCNYLSNSCCSCISGRPNALIYLWPNENLSENASRIPNHMDSDGQYSSTNVQAVRNTEFVEDIQPRSKKPINCTRVSWIVFPSLRREKSTMLKRFYGEYGTFDLTKFPPSLELWASASVLLERGESYLLPIDPKQPMIPFEIMISPDDRLTMSIRQGTGVMGSKYSTDPNQLLKRGCYYSGFEVSDVGLFTEVMRRTSSEELIGGM
ncbi:hypothetical protein M405DRAFT_836659 [Rhizopogon salebrosus TDB-379]|nr:hypothetical protein M405DRAFT_836659 [Rhizopogon salebrosus TDB-379]